MDLPLRQSLLLGAYLAHREDWVARDELIGVFWPDDPEATARHNLSQLVYHCRRQPWFDGLEADRTRLRWRIDSDVRLFRAALGEGAWHDALALYRGPLLEGAPATLPLGFETWLEREREALHGAWRDAVLQVADGFEREGRWADAAAQLRPVLAQDALAEDVLQAYLRCAGMAGQRDAALRAFDAFEAQLRSELDLTPLEATRDLAERLRRGEDPVDAPPGGRAGAQADAASPRGDRAAAVPEDRPVPRRNFPAAMTPFVGRATERAQLHALLTRDGARCVTLIGPGGSGKTRLGLVVGLRAAAWFDDGAVFVPLADTVDPALLSLRVLEALQVTPPAGEDPGAFLRAWLAPRSLLIVLDNVEHLLDGAGTLLELLEASAGSSALVTSTEPLDLPGEVRFEVAGLALPGPADEAIEAFDAVTLFLRSARRAHPSFVPAPGDRDGIVRLCRLLAGMPLAIELAAPWMRLLRPAEVADAVEANLDLLATEQRYLPPRHRSVRAMLDHAWSLLSDAEREALATTSVFRGGFDKDAAERVTGASLRTQLALVNKSLLQRTPDGRFTALPVVRRYGLDRAAEAPARHEEVEARHAEHFAALAVEAGPHLVGEEQATWLGRLARDHDNLRAALAHLSRTRSEERALEAAYALSRFWWLRGHYQEGRATVTSVLALSDAPTLARARLLGQAGAFARLCEDYDAAEALFEQSLEAKRAFDDPASIAATLGNLGNLRRLRGDPDGGERLLRESLAIQRAIGDDRSVANTLNNLGALVGVRGDHDGSEALYREALEIARRSGQPLVAAFALGNLSSIATRRGDLEAARRGHVEALATFEQLGYQVGLAVTTQSLGDVALQSGDLAEARARYAEALRRFHDLGDHRGIAEVLGSLVGAAIAADDAEQALRLAGASRGLHERLGIVATADARADLEARIALARARLGAQRTEALLVEGARLDADAAVAWVLADDALTPPG